jgi:uncharacterized protein YegJ (DUF2314 family)
MKNELAIVLLSWFAVAGCARDTDQTSVSVAEREDEPMVTAFESEDQEMNAAMARARATLAEFEKRLTDPPATQEHIALKGRFEEGGEAEHMWVNDVVVTSEGYEGTLGNNPVHIKSITSGDQVSVRRENVSDWLVIDGGKLVGGYTLRVQRARMTPEQRRQFDAQTAFTIED